MAAPPTQQPSGRVFDIGYTPYTGSREGRGLARRTIFVDGVKNGMGIGRGGWAKFLPWLVVAPTIVVGIVFAVIAAVFYQVDLSIETGETDGIREELGHMSLISATTFLLLVFAAFVGPELICPDRRNRIIHLYFVRPITMLDYLGARWFAFFALVFAAASLPHVALWVGLLFGVTDATEHLRENWLDVPRFFANAAIFAALVSSLTFALSSVTDRRMIATLIVFAVIILSPIVGQVVSLFDATNLVVEAASIFDLINLTTVIVPQIVFGEFSTNHELNILVPIAVLTGVTVLSMFATWRFYHAKR